MMTDKEFADWLRTVPREQSPEEVNRREKLDDIERGGWVQPHEFPHHYGEAAH